MGPPARASGTNWKPQKGRSSKTRKHSSAVPTRTVAAVRLVHRATSSPESGGSPPAPRVPPQVSPRTVPSPLFQNPQQNDDDDESMLPVAEPRDHAMPQLSPDRATEVEGSQNQNQNRAIAEVAGQLDMDESEMLLYVSMNVKLHYFAYKKFLGGTLISKEETRLQQWLQKQLKLTDERLEKDWPKIRTQVAKTLRSKRSAVTTEIKELFLGEFSCLIVRLEL